MPAITTIIFDMFNTIAQDGPEHWRQTLAEIIAEQDLDTTPDLLRQAWDDGSANFRRRRIDPGVPFISYLDGWTDAFSVAFHTLNLPGDARAASRKSISALSRRPLWPEAPEALSLLGSRYRLAVLSNADDAYLNPVIARIPTRFAAVISSEAAQCYKPDRRLFEAALRRLRAAPSGCAYVGDKQFEDVTGARGAGIPAVWINRAAAPPDPALPAPDAEIRSLLELPNALAALGQP